MTVRLILKLIDIAFLILQQIDKKAHEDKVNQIIKDSVDYQNRRSSGVVSDDIDKAMRGDS